MRIPLADCSSVARGGHLQPGRTSYEDRRFRATPVNIPFRAPYVFSYGSMASVTETIVEVVTDDGVTGLGEVADGDRSADVLKMRERLLGWTCAICTPRSGVACRPCATRPGATSSRPSGPSAVSRWLCGTRAAGSRACRCYLLLGGAVRPGYRRAPNISATGIPAPAIPANPRRSPVARYCARMIEQHGPDGFEGKVRHCWRSPKKSRWFGKSAPPWRPRLRLDANMAGRADGARGLERIEPL